MWLFASALSSVTRPFTPMQSNASHFRVHKVSNPPFSEGGSSDEPPTSRPPLRGVRVKSPRGTRDFVSRPRLDGNGLHPGLRSQGVIVISGYQPIPKRGERVSLVFFAVHHLRCAIAGGMAQWPGAKDSPFYSQPLSDNRRLGKTPRWENMGLDERGRHRQGRRALHLGVRAMRTEQLPEWSDWPDVDPGAES